MIDVLLKKTHKSVDKNVAWFDNIKCTNCGYDGLVNTGTEYCPECGKCGVLAWKENEPQEINN